MAKYKTTIEVDGVAVLTTWYDDLDNVFKTDQQREWKRYNVPGDVWTKALLELNRITFEISNKKIAGVSEKAEKFWSGGTLQ